MQSGKLDRRVTLLQWSSATDGWGQPTEGFSEGATVFAELRQQSGSEFFSSSSEVSEQKAVFRIRYRDGLTTQDRLQYDGREWDIIDIRELGRKRGLDLHAEARS